MKTEKEFSYNLRIRPFGIGCQPEGFLRWEEDETRFGRIIYPKELSRRDREHFSLHQIIDTSPYEGKQVYFYEDYKADIGFREWRNMIYVDILKYDHEGNHVDTETHTTGEFLDKLEDGEYILTDKTKKP